MNYPLLSEYIESIKSAGDNFDQLKHLRPVLDDDGQPVMTSGNFAVVFKMKDEKIGKLHAVKCFLRDQEGRAEAYRQIAEELEYISSTFLTPIKFLDKELFVDTSNSDENEFPVLLMDWVDGQTLDKYIREHIDDQYDLSLLAYQFSRLAMWLLPQPFAHGDLKPDNILVKDDGTLVLVDYDGMYVPAMKGQRARELGSPDFRHPSRTEDIFDEHIDDFSLVSILLSLKAITLQPELLEQYGTSDRLLFSEKDYRNLSGSRVMDVLKTMMQDPELATLYSLFILSSAQNNLSQTSFRLLNLNRPQVPVTQNLNTVVTKEDLASAWEDEYGVKYSADKKRLLKAPEHIKNYSIRKGTKVICHHAFYGSKVEKVFLPDSILSIGYDAFSDCRKLTNINIPNSVLLIENHAFSCCCCLKNINIPNSISIIFGGLFSKCSSLISVNIPNSVKIIAYGAFSGCTGLIKVNIGNSVSEISYNAFAGCCNLRYINLPNSVRAIGHFAFHGCSRLENINIPNSVTMIDFGVFYECPQLSSIIIPLGSRAKFEKLLPDYKDKFVEEEIDNYSTEVTEEDLANSWLDNFGARYSEDWKRLLKGPNSEVVKTMVVNNQNFNKADMWVKGPVINKKTSKTTYWCSFDSFENGVLIYISSEVWKDLSEVNPDTLWEVFSNGNYIIREAHDEETNEWLMYENNHPMMMITPMREMAHASWDSDNLDAYFKELVETTDYSIKQGTECICDKAFERCLELKSVSIPDGIVIIGRNAFSGCFDLESINIPESVIEIGDFAFDMCHSLKSIFIPLNVRCIGCGAFSDNRGLSAILVDERNLFYDSRNNCNAIINRKSNSLERGCISTIIPDNITVIGDYAFSGCNAIESIMLPYGIEEIGEYAFSNCEMLSSIEIPDSVSIIRDFAFDSCYSLKTIYLPNSLLKIGKMSFNECGVLDQIVIPKGTKQKFEELLPEDIDKIVEQDEDENLSTEVTKEDLANGWEDEFGAKYSKDGKRLLKFDDEYNYPIYHGGYIVKDGVEIICDDAFSDCHHLKMIILPQTTTIIGNGSFSNCCELNKIDLPSNLMSIGDGTFYQCYSLKSICIPAKVSHIGTNPFAGSGITKVLCDSEFYITDNNALYDKDQKELIAVYQNVEDVMVPRSVIKIGDYSCYECRNLDTIDLQNGILSIGNYAFAHSSLNTIKLPNTLTRIGEAAFDDTNIPTIYIPSRVESIGDFAFDNCEYCHSFLIERGNRLKFEGMLSGYKKTIVEIDYAERNEWIMRTRPFSSDEIAAVESAIFTSIQNKRMVRFDLVEGGYTMIPLDERCSFSEGKTIDLNNAKLIMYYHNGSVDTYKVFVECKN